MKKIKTVSVLGPTASGKTGLAIALAKRNNGEIISCDSMQLYRGMDIGTATPTIAERDGVPHHLMDIIDPQNEFSAADYARLAAEKIEEIASRGKLPILCGGTGLYHDSVMKITSFTESESNEALREELYAYARENGAVALHEKLREIDPEAADAVHPNNVKRVVRAIEIYRLTGKTKTETDREQTRGESRYDDRAFVIDFRNRATLYERIDRRVDCMMSEGLEEEARRLLSDREHLSRTAFQAIGYKEFLPYFDGDATIDDVVAEIKLATHHYAKRQMIWFRRDPSLIRLVPDEGEQLLSSDELARLAEQYII